MRMFEARFAIVVGEQPEMVRVDRETFHCAGRIIAAVSDLGREFHLGKTIFGEDALVFGIDLEDAPVIAVQNEKVSIREREVAVMRPAESESWRIDEK